ncbi:hypothetical protein [Halostagnicola sp. A-GB9-2]|uniref:DNA replication complex subunit Gins51 n=1 Tax=Halostagnicola sp. A-GB9-2 TaxID=3048066 RepID=UPI0024C0685F|nr:hypothetical protein [Halostagnicola sp. A-GB9-2]MDJ1431597.1 hypothetical protein [Halostagnicola sp. A-GB9-2]
MNLDELRSVQSKERQKDSLQNLRPSFYQEVGEYIADLEDERDRVAEATDDPFASPEVSQLTDEIETAKDVVEAIYERRMGKLVKQASLSAAGMAANDEGLTAEEADLFDDLIDRIQSNKNRVLDVLEGVDAEAGTQAETEALEGEGEPTASERTGSPTASAETGEEAIGGSAIEPEDRTSPAPPESQPESANANESVSDASDSSPDSSTVTAADVMGGDPPEPAESSGTDPAEPEPEAPPKPPAPDGDEGADSTTPSTGTEGDTNDGASLERLTVKITEDVGSILGVDDREYTLAADDVVTLPEQNATPLVEREAAEQLE